MFKLLKSISSPLASLSILMFAVGLFSTFVPMRLTITGYSPFIIGAVTAAYFAGLVIGSVKVERFIARVGHIRTFSAFASSTGALFIIMSLIVHPVIWAMSRFVMGFFTAGLFIVIESWLLMIGGRENKGTILSFYMIAFYAAQAGGQFLLGMLQADSLIPFCIGTLFISLSVLPVALTKQKTPTVEGRSLLSPLKLFRITAFGILSSYGSGLIMGCVFGLAPFFAYSIGMNSAEVARFMGYTVIGGFLLQWPLGRLSDKMNRRTVLIGVSFITGLLSLAMAIAALFAPHSLTLLTILFGGFAFTMYPMSISYTNDHLDPKDLVAATGGLLLAYGAGCVTGPLLAPIPMKIIGPSGLFIFFALVATVIGIFGFVRRHRKAAVPLQDQVHFRAVSRMTPIGAELDPRADDTSKSVMTVRVETVERRGEPSEIYKETVSIEKEAASEPTAP